MQTAGDPDVLLTTMEVAARLQVHHKTVRKLLDDGLLKFVRYSARGNLHFRREDVDAFMAASIKRKEPHHE